MPNTTSELVSRRAFIGIVSATLAATSALFARPRAAFAANPMPVVSEHDAQAKALGYVHQAAEADAMRFPKVATPAGRKQNCANCRLYTGATQEQWGPCALFPGKAVNKGGWCAAWLGRS